MGTTRDVFGWLARAGSLAPTIVLHRSADHAGEDILHGHSDCRAVTRATSPCVFDVAEIANLDARLCVLCAPLVLGEPGDDIVVHTYLTIRSIDLLEKAADLRPVRYTDTLPGLAGERVHYVVDYVKRTITRGDYGTSDGPLVAGIESTIDTLCAQHPRRTRAEVMTEATRLAAVMNAIRNHPRCSDGIVDALVSGQDPPAVLAMTPAPDRSGVGQLIDDVEERISNARTVFVLLAGCGDPVYRPASHLLEAAVQSSVRYRGQHRIVGELPDEVCAWFPARQRKSERGPHPRPLPLEWEPVDEAVIETALTLQAEADPGHPWENLTEAFATAIALG